MTGIVTRRRPFVSLVVPTRNRPALVGSCVESLLAQTVRDVEVIVADNHTGAPCRAVVEAFGDPRVRYVVPPAPLAMHDNWESACSLAEGQYVAVVIDKTVLRPSAVEVLGRTLDRHPAEVVSWWNEAYVPDDPEGGGSGAYWRAHRPRPPREYDPWAELVRRFAFGARRGREGVRYGWGKICFGAYHRDLLARIRETVGRVFLPFNPDYTSMVAALAHARTAVDVGQPLVISTETRISNGKRIAESDRHARDFVRTVDGSLRILDDLPLRGLYTSVHNLVAHDYVVMGGRLGGRAGALRVGLRNLIARAGEDLDRVRTWSSPAVRAEQRGLWRAYLRRLRPADRLAVRSQIWRERLVAEAARRPSVASALQRCRDRLRGNPVEVRRCRTIVEAALQADRCYREAI
jgi:cellulose synthase/poly-beta-1,6-N-acetylglucosamine synthase-like glycosyltransferase